MVTRAVRPRRFVFHTAELLVVFAALSVVLALARLTVVFAVIGPLLFAAGVIGRVVSRKQVGWVTGCMMATTFAIPGAFVGAAFPGHGVLAGLALGSVVGAFAGAHIAVHDFV